MSKSIVDFNAASSLDSDTSKKAKKSLLVIGSSTLLFATFTITSNEVSLFNFAFEVSHEKLVEVGRFMTMVCLFIFIVREIPMSLGTLKTNKQKQLFRDERLAKKSFSDSISGEDEPTSNQEVIEMIAANFETSRKDSSERYDRIIRHSLSASVWLIDILLPVFLALIVIKNPYSLNLLLSQ